jgi:hypothetical protein
MTMHDRQAIIDAVTSLFWHTDHHDWDLLAEVLDERVRLDYTAMQGGEPASMTPSEVVAGWRPAFLAIDAHQHLVGNHLVVVAAEQASVTASFIATHQWRGDTWTLGGDYLIELTQHDGPWRVTALKMTPVWQTGNPNLIPDALAAAAGRSPSSGSLDTGQ